MPVPSQIYLWSVKQNSNEMLIWNTAIQKEKSYKRDAIAPGGKAIVLLQG